MYQEIMVHKYVASRIVEESLYTGTWVGVKEYMCIKRRVDITILMHNFGLCKAHNAQITGCMYNFRALGAL